MKDFGPSWTLHFKDQPLFFITANEGIVHIQILFYMLLKNISEQNIMKENYKKSWRFLLLIFFLSLPSFGA